jgi:hypothetical protein
MIEHGARIAAAAQRKIAAAAAGGFASGVSPDLPRHRAADALAALRGVRFEAVVFDLDGTIADAPVARADVRTALERLAQAGVRIAIATGRAPSERALALMRGLVAERHWNGVLIGYRNGAQLGRLDTDAVEMLRPLDQDDFTALRGLLAARLATLDADVLLVVDMPAQITLRSAHGRYVEHPERLIAVAREAIATSKACAKALQSGHSIDIVHMRTSKAEIASMLGADERPVLRFGDTGMASGNDFELLAHPHGLSVDHVSADLDVCWNFLPPGVGSVEGTLHYLAHLDLTGSGTAAFAERFFA